MDFASTAGIVLTLEANALLLIGLGLPLWRRRVPPNRWYGFRTPATLRDEALWYEVNGMTGKDLVIVGSVLAIMAPTLALAALPRPWVVIPCVAWVVAGSLALTVRGLLLVRAHKRGTASGPSAPHGSR